MMMRVVMEINVLIDESFEECLEGDWLEGIVEKVIAAEDTGSGVELSLVITTQEKVHELNRTYRGKDKPTDVLSFCMMSAEDEPDAASAPFVAPPDGIIHLGEVIISYPQAVIQAEEHRHSVKKEISFLIIHGVLHLLGYDHEEPEMEQEMRAREKEILGSVEEMLAE